MLVYERKVNDSFIIDPDITIKILSINTNSVKIGIDAPKNIFITRREQLGQDSRLEVINEPEIITSKSYT